MCQVNSGLLVGFMVLFLLITFANPSGLAGERGKRMISLLVPSATAKQLQAVALHPTELAKGNDAEHCSFHIFMATTGEFHMKERKRTGVKVQLPWQDVQGEENTSTS